MQITGYAVVKPVSDLEFRSNPMRAVSKGRFGTIARWCRFSEARSYLSGDWRCLSDIS